MITVTPVSIRSPTGKPLSASAIRHGGRLGSGIRPFLQIQTLDRPRARHAVQTTRRRISNGLASGPNVANERSRVISAPCPQASQRSFSLSPASDITLCSVSNIWLKDHWA
jgi:hypothetical protein